jgi:hypothetical protein
MTTRIVPIGDFHTGIRVGFLSPGYMLDGEKAIPLGKAQKFIQKRFKIINKFLDDNPVKKLIVVLMGDQIHGPNVDGLRYMDIVDGKTQCDAFLHSIGPLAARADSIYVIDDGSRFHVDAGRWSSDYVAQELGAFGRQAYPKVYLKAEGLKFKFKHHGPSLGWREHTRGDPVRRYLRDEHAIAVKRGEYAPDVAVFAHLHQPWEEHLRVRYPTGHRVLHAYYTPAMCSADHRTLTRVDKVELATIGCLAIDVENGEHVVHKLYDDLDVRVNVSA